MATDFIRSLRAIFQASHNCVILMEYTPQKPKLTFVNKRLTGAYHYDYFKEESTHGLYQVVTQIALRSR